MLGPWGPVSGAIRAILTGPEPIRLGSPVSARGETSMALEGGGRGAAEGLRPPRPEGPQPASASAQARATGARHLVLTPKGLPLSMNSPRNLQLRLRTAIR